ncbi:MAG: trypsin-like peptidase domain-containing protein [Candidatus Pacebacteria bacterium]|nr:trypsin-like peptidase domain-containing protein [Candidatus Paceibacterota bacterium]
MYIEISSKKIQNKIKSFLATLKGLKISFPKIKIKGIAKTKISFVFLVLAIFLVFALGFWGGDFFAKQAKGELSGLFGQVKEFVLNKGFNQAPILPPIPLEEYKPQTSQEEAIINVVKNASPSVVSVIISKDMPVYEQYVETQPFSDFFGGQIQIQVPKTRQKGTQRQVIGSGSGFIVSSDGTIITNKHVVSDQDAFYEVITSEGKKYPAKVLAKDPLQDLAIMKITQKATSSPEVFPAVSFGNSDLAIVGQTAIAIGNALGEFSNSVSVGVISGLSRSITAEGGGVSEDLQDILQTDAAINKGNSGGPLLNLKGEVIGVNVAVAEGAQSIGFAIPVNKARRDIRQLREQGKISYPFLGIRYVLINSDIQETEKLSVDYGALVSKGDTANEPAIEPGSSAQKAGLKENDIILEVDGVKITSKIPLANIVQNQHIPGDKIVLKVLRGAKEMEITVTLGEKSSE